MTTKFCRLLVALLLCFCASNALAIDLPDRRENREPTLTDAINAAIIGRRPLDDFTITARWDGVGSVTLWGEGLGVIDQKTHFVIDREPYVALLKSLRKANFVTLPQRFGNEPKQGVAGATLGSVALLVGEQKHQKHIVTQFPGELNKEFKALAEEIIAVAKAAVGKTVLPNSLAEGIEQLAGGKLPPRAFRLVLARTATNDAEGLQLTLQGRKLIARTNTKLGVGQEVKRTLEEDEWTALLKLLRDEEVPAWPPQLHASRYTSLNVGILNHALQVQARPEKIANKADGPDLTRQLESVIAHLEALSTAADKKAT